MTTLVKKVRKLFGGKEEGASLAEYGLLVALIAVVCVAGVTVLGAEINALLTSFAGSL